jgi:hypothetical protein
MEALIPIGRGKLARRAYGIDEIALVPGSGTLDPALADTTWSIGGIVREIPIIASAMDGVVDGNVAVRLTELGALGVLNLEGLQTRYESPTPILERITQVGNEEFVGLMQELYQEPIKPELVIARIQEIKQRGGIAAVSSTPGRATTSGSLGGAGGGGFVFRAGDRRIHSPFGFAGGGLLGFAPVLPGVTHARRTGQLCHLRSGSEPDESGGGGGVGGDWSGGGLYFPGGARGGGSPGDGGGGLCGGSGGLPRPNGSLRPGDCRWGVGHRRGYL